MMLRGAATVEYLKRSGQVRAPWSDGGLTLAERF